MSTPGNDYFGALIKKERERLGLSQQQAADLCSVRREMWGKYERGIAEPGVGVILKFCAGGADPANLFEIKNSEYGKAANTILKCFDDYRPRNGEPLHETIYDFVDGWNVGTVMSSPVDEDNESITLAFKLFPKITFENISTRSFNLPINAIPCTKYQETVKSDEDAVALLVNRFYSFEAHEIEIRDHPDHTGVGIPPEPPTRENVLAQFCGLYTQFGPMGVGLPNWMTGVYPTLTPEILHAAIRVIEAAKHVASKEGWVSIHHQNWSMWMATVAELVANGVAPSEVLARFRPPPHAATPGTSPDSETTNRML